ncbi:hypothetical protein [Henriciella sp.]|uniref:hypothetical protein n=1 Tax=Henriciella sp. TaxID=1968823 RepID=UPI002634D45C|nr:hypothetical protein [Henriciella sp.]
MPSSRLAVILGLVIAGCATATMLGQRPVMAPEPETLDMRLPDIGVTPANQADGMRLRNIESEDARPRERAGLPDCGLPSRPMSIFPELGGDSVTFGQAGSFYVYDVGDQTGGPDLDVHDKLILPGLPTEPEIMVGENSVAFCYVERGISIVVFRQMCAGPDWNNSFESITFDGGATFVDPAVLAQLAPGEPYLSAERLEQLGIDWLSDEARSGWQVMPMPALLRPSAAAITQCETDTIPLPDNWKSGSHG